jgi:hypothetical protein
VRIVPPAAINPDVGYAEFAGWVRGGRVRIVREAVASGKANRSLQLVRLDAGSGSVPESRTAGRTRG